MRKTRVCSILVIIAFTILCYGSFSMASPYPQAKLAIMSDLHIYDSSLGVSGKAFTDYLNEDRKLLKESVELAEEAVKAIIASDAEIVLVPGDLTKDGELVDHRIVVSLLSKLSAAGKQVYVVPGNHDINNAQAMSYSGDTATRVENITPVEFADLYKDFGYGSALMRDPNSLSYVAEPKAGLWILALDSCRYRENPAQGESIVSGNLSAPTLAWVGTVLDMAAKDGTAVVAMMHHNLIEHLAGQKAQFPDYVLTNNTETARLLAAKGVNLVFTGHFHAQDIVAAKIGSNTIYEVETGSLVTYPNPYRFGELSGTSLSLVTQEVAAIPSAPNLVEESKKTALEGLDYQARKTLAKYKVTGKSADILAPQIAQKFLGHYMGDEPKDAPPISTKGLSLWAKLINLLNGKLLRGLSNDLPPGDRNVVLSW